MDTGQCRPRVPQRHEGRTQRLAAKRHQCPKPGCGKSFSRPSHLARHALNHFAVEFECHRCAASFKRRDLLGTSMSGRSCNIHAIYRKIWRCALFGFSFIARSQLPNDIYDDFFRKISESNWRRRDLFRIGMSWSWFLGGVCQMLLHNFLSRYEHVLLPYEVENRLLGRRTRFIVGGFQFRACAWSAKSSLLSACGMT